MVWRGRGAGGAELIVHQESDEVYLEASSYDVIMMKGRNA